MLIKHSCTASRLTTHHLKPSNHTYCLQSDIVFIFSLQRPSAFRAGEPVACKQHLHKGYIPNLQTCSCLIRCSLWYRYHFIIIVCTQMHRTVHVLNVSNCKLEHKWESFASLDVNKFEVYSITSEVKDTGINKTSGNLAGSRLICCVTSNWHHRMPQLCFTAQILHIHVS